MDPVGAKDLTPSQEGRLIVYAEHQAEYTPLPTYQFDDGRVYSEWSPTPEEVALLMSALATGEPVKIRLWQWTFGQPLQPVLLEVVP